MIKLTSDTGAPVWFNVMNILSLEQLSSDLMDTFSVAKDSKGTLIRTLNQVRVVQEDLDTVVKAIEKQLIFLSGGGQ